MQYRVPKKPAAALLAVGVMASAACSLLVFASLGIGKILFLLPASLLLFVLSALIVARFVVFDCVYRLTDRYGEYFFSFYILKGRQSYLSDKIEFVGKEKLVLLDKKGRKEVKKRQKYKDMTSNLIPHKRYALLFEKDGKACYAVLELGEAFASALNNDIRHAQMMYSSDLTSPDETDLA